MRFLEGAYFWVRNRLTGARCYAEGCGGLPLLHTPWQYRRCLDTPLGITLTDPGWLYANGIDPRSTPEPVVPVSRAS
jgi:hypothetical protein